MKIHLKDSINIYYHQFNKIICLFVCLFKSLLNIVTPSLMKGYWGHLHKDRPGTIKLTPEDTDDIWNLYNIISTGDEVECATIRWALRLANHSLFIIIFGCC